MASTAASPQSRLSASSSAPAIAQGTASVAENRYDRLVQLSREWGLLARSPLTPLPRPDQAPSYRTPNDDFLAEELLKRQRMAESQNDQSNRTLSRAFTTKKKGWEYREIYSALVNHIANRGSPGVAEALVAKLNLAGGNLNLQQKSRTSLLSRRKSLDLSERSQILQMAVKNCQLEMVEVLLPYADALSLDTSLPIAIRSRHEGITALLVRYGASAAQTADGQDAFRQTCAVGGQAQIIAHILGSDGRPSIPWISQCMVEAARIGCAETVSLLAQSTADGNHDGAAALKTAVSLGRRDIVLAIALGSQPPMPPGLNEAFQQLIDNQSINPNEKLAMMEILLCVGADGDVVAGCLAVACEKDLYEHIRLLVLYGASLEYANSKAIRRAVAKGNIDLVQVMLSGKSTLSANTASACIELLPKNLRLEDRYSFLELLLGQGATGIALDETLIDAVEAGDIEAVKLLLNPLSLKKINNSPNLSNSPSSSTRPMSKVIDWHAIPSTNHKGGLALQLAINKPDIDITKAILSNKPPSPDVLAHVFPSTKSLPPRARHEITELFLVAGISGPVVHSALEEAIMEKPPQRDEDLISLLLRFNADVNFNGGGSINAAIAQADTGLLRSLLGGNPTPQIMSRAIPKAMQTEDRVLRLEIIGMLLKAGAVSGGPETSLAVDLAIQGEPADKDLLRMLLQNGADVNISSGIAVAHAAKNPDFEVLKLVLDLSKPNSESMELALQNVEEMPASKAKADKLGALVPLVNSRDSVARVLISEVRGLTNVPTIDRDLSPLQTLLAHGADVDFKNGEAMQIAVAAMSEPILDILFTGNPNSITLAFVMPAALRLRESGPRLKFAQKILKLGIPPTEVNRALVFAVKTYYNDIPLIEALVAVADTQDGAALIEAIKNERQDVVQLLLAQKIFSQDILNMGFTHAASCKNRRTRSISCSSLLKAGASGEVVSDALLAAASDGDVDFGTILVENGGSIQHRDGQAVIAACKSGSIEVLEMLLAGKSEIAHDILEKGFQAATDLGDLKKREEVFKLLLQRGVTGEVVDAQLISAVRYGDLGTDLVKLLLKHGASPDYNDGESVEKATRSALLDSLKMLLGLADIGVQKKPSSHTLVRAMDACWDLKRDTRLTVLEWIFSAGKPSPSSIHTALGRAVNEEEPDEDLIRILIHNRASPVVNNCKTLIDASKTLPPSAFHLLLQAKVSPEDASRALSNVFVLEHSQSWLSDRGHEILRSLLDKGAEGPSLDTALSVALASCDEGSTGVVRNFVETLLGHGADVNYNAGEALQTAAKFGDPGILRRLLQQKPSSETLTWAFPNVFDANVAEDDVGELITLFTEYSDGNHQLDVMSVPPGSQPVLLRALSQFPRSTKILEALLDAGYYHEQMANYKVMEELDEEEPVTLLMWALLQPQKKISSSVINVLIDRGAKVNFETRLSRVTPLMVAIQTRRQDLVKSLLLAQAEVDVTDATGRSPLSMASAIGGELSVTIMSNLLAAGASTNDGSLHNASRELNLQAMQVLVEFEHDPDFPSPIHGGRSALGELCLHAADSGEITAMREKAMEKAITFLIKSDTDITLQIGGKSVLHLALESADPVTTTKVLLRAGMWKHVNKSFNQYTDGEFTFSPTMYVERMLPQSDFQQQLVTLLRNNRGTDVYYANSGPQPDDAKGLPEYMKLEEQDRKAQLERHRKEEQEHVLAMARTKELAAVQRQIWADQAELEDARKKRAHHTDMSQIRERAQAEEDHFNSLLRQQRMRQSAEISHQEALTSAGIARVQTIGDAESNIASKNQQRLLAWERDLGNERVGNANQLSNIRVREREDVERLDKAADSRIKDRLREQKKLVDSQTALANTIGNHNGAGRRQIGYVAGELD